MSDPLPPSSGAQPPPPPVPREPRPDGAPPRRRRRGRRGGGPPGARDGAPRPQQSDSRGPRPQHDSRGPRPDREARPPRPDDPRRPRGRRGKRRDRDDRPPSPAQPSALERTLEGSHIDASKPAEIPLTPDEVAEMRQHLRFLFRNREALRLKVNAAEDLLLNGAKEPTHRGQVLHLLGKVDLASVTSALTRVPDAKARAALLAGVVRFSSDVGILLLYLESLGDGASPKDAAAAFRLAVRRIDFAGISASRMRRVLDLVASTFEGHERVQVLSGLFASETFRGAFDAVQDALPPELAGIFVPLRVAYETILEGRPNEHGAAALKAGVTALLDAPDDVLRSHPEPVRERLLEQAIRLLEDPALEDRATDALLGTLPRESRSFSRVGMLRAAELLRRHDDERARDLLVQIKQAHSGFHMPAKWLTALEAPRVARIALWKDAAAEGSRFRSGFWLDAQRSAWARIGAPEDADAVTRDALLQRQVAIAGVAPVLECGVSPEGVPYVLLPVVGRPLSSVLARRSLDGEQASGLALAAAQALHGLALAGVELPDFDAARLLGADGSPPQIWVGDLTGARRTDASSASRSHLAHALAFCRVVEAASRERDVRLAPEGVTTLPDLIRALAARG